MSDFEKARWMGRNGRRTVIERFSWDVIASHTLGVYGIAPKPLSEEIGDIEGKKKPDAPSPHRYVLRRRTQGTARAAADGGARAFEEGAARG
jgi:hypothetical protein